MKTILALMLVPFFAHASSDIACDSEGTGGQLAITISSAQGLGTPQSRVHIVSKGLFLLAFDAVVDQAVENETQTAIDITTLVNGELVTPDSGKATITLDKLPTGGLSGTGKIVLTKLPKVKPPVRLEHSYDLTNCKGAI